MIFYTLIAISLVAVFLMARGCYIYEDMSIIFTATIWSLIMALFCCLIYIPIDNYFNVINTAIPFEQPIISFTSDRSISGSFFIGSGSIDTVEYYFYYALREDGNYIRQKQPVESSSIQEMPEGSTNQPCIKWNALTYKNPKWVGPNFSDPGKSEHVFVVPHGTIIQRFSL